MKSFKIFFSKIEHSSLSIKMLLLFFSPIVAGICTCIILRLDIGIGISSGVVVGLLSTFARYIKDR